VKLSQYLGTGGCGAVAALSAALFSKARCGTADKMAGRHAAKVCRQR
jgi:hypothetical protein